jgi:hypothetical protein
MLICLYLMTARCEVHGFIWFIWLVTLPVRPGLLWILWNMNKIELNWTELNWIEQQWWYIYENNTMYTRGPKTKCCFSIKPSFTGWTDITVVWHSDANNGLSTNDQFCFQGSRQGQSWESMVMACNDIFVKQKSLIQRFCCILHTHLTSWIKK